MSVEASVVAPEGDFVAPVASVEVSVLASLAELVAWVADSAVCSVEPLVAECHEPDVQAADWAAHLAAASVEHSVDLHSAVAQVADLVEPQAADSRGLAVLPVAELAER